MDEIEIIKNILLGRVCETCENQFIGRCSGRDVFPDKITCERYESFSESTLRQIKRVVWMKI